MSADIVVTQAIPTASVGAAPASRPQHSADGAKRGEHRAATAPTSSVLGAPLRSGFVLTHRPLLREQYTSPPLNVPVQERTKSIVTSRSSLSPGRGSALAPPKPARLAAGEWMVLVSCVAIDLAERFTSTPSSLNSISVPYNSAMHCGFSFNGLHRR